uniref:Zinc finger matrin-type protein 5 n=1 Tax=Lygus hesperus TaxID=30085 RepID=A0A0A9W1C0_LYGHE
MGKRYFCDYCQRSFVDDIESRKKHLNGVSHLRMKKEYYFMIRDMKTLVQEERSKEPCRRFRNTGECSFGVLCNHTHYTPEELAHFETTVQLQEKERSKLPNIEEWLAKKTELGKKTTDVHVQGFTTLLDPSLPPSLRLPSLNEINSTCNLEWG